MSGGGVDPPLEMMVWVKVAPPPSERAALAPKAAVLSVDLADVAEWQQGGAVLGYRLPLESDGYDGDGQGGQFGASAASPP